jgi:hypothetical protein
MAKAKRRKPVRSATLKVKQVAPRSRARRKKRIKKSAEQKPLTIRKLEISAGALRALTAEQRSALFLLGLFLNEANWLRKLLVMAIMSMGDDPDGQASFALTVNIAMTLAAKIYEGWKKAQAGTLAKTIHSVALPDELKALRKQINRALGTPTVARIRNSYSFHYPATLDFAKLPIEDADSIIYVTDGACNGDVFSHLSSLVALEPLLAVNAQTDWRQGLEDVWNEVTNVTGLYCFFLSEALGLLITKWLPGKVTSSSITKPDAQKLHEASLQFFCHPPSNLQELRDQIITDATK